VSFEEQNDNVQEKISEHILKSNGGCCVYYPSNIYCAVLAGTHLVM